MRTKENIKELMHALQAASDREIHFDEEAIVSVYQKKDADQSLAIKILSVFGGILVCLAFIGFLFLADIFRSAESITLLGVFCITASAVVSRFLKKIITDTLSVSFYITGFALLGFGLASQGNDVELVFIVIASAVLLLAQNYILSFISVLIINGSIAALIISGGIPNLVYVFIAVQALIITFMLMQEAKIITAGRKFSALYDPVRTGMVFSFLGTLVYTGFETKISISTFYTWSSSVVIILAILYVVSVLMKTLYVTDTSYKIVIYLLTVLILSPTVLFPAIPGAILIILLSFMVNDKTGFATACLGLIYFIGKFYYDLHLTLLTKSILLFSSGILFLAIYRFIHKKLISHEKI